MWMISTNQTAMMTAPAVAAVAYLPTVLSEVHPQQGTLELFHRYRPVAVRIDSLRAHSRVESGTRSSE